MKKEGEGGEGEGRRRVGLKGGWATKSNGMQRNQTESNGLQRNQTEYNEIAHSQNGPLRDPKKFQAKLPHI